MPGGYTLSATKIEWCHYTLNPWIGCAKVSEACRNCYAENQAARFGNSLVDKGWRPAGQRDGELRLWGPNGSRIFAPDKYMSQVLSWDRAARRAGERRRVFVASMADIFERHSSPAVATRQNEARWALWDLIAETNNLDFLLLTKRPEHLRRCFVRFYDATLHDKVWLGVTVEDQQQHDARLHYLSTYPARHCAQQFVSYEPALGPVKWRLDHVDWLIAGCESGRGARDTNPDWVRSARDQCQAAGTRFFLKQLRVDGKVQSLPELDGRQWTEVPE